MSNEPEWRNKRDLDEQSAMSKHYINSRLAIIFSTLVLICDTLLWTTQYNLDIEAELDLHIAQVAKGQLITKQNGQAIILFGD